MLFYTVGKLITQNPHTTNTAFSSVYKLLILSPKHYGFPVGDDPEVGGDPGVVEHLLREGDDGFKPIGFDDPASDLRLAAPGGSCE